jgi:CBS-domain-containing membrane protein
MTTDIITVTPDTPIREAAQLMFRNRVSGLPVCGADSCLVGIISEADFLRLEVAREEAENPLPVETVGEVMQTDVVTIHPDATLSDAAKVMVIHEIKRLPVVGHQMEIMGIISRIDVVAAFTRPDEIIEDEIREDLLRRVLFVDPDDISVTVSEGVVAFTGEIGTRDESRLLEELARRLDGVMRVDNQLTWRLDDA